jgi:hypothetical protein
MDAAGFYVAFARSASADAGFVRIASIEAAVKKAILWLSIKPFSSIISRLPFWRSRSSL